MNAVGDFSSVPNLTETHWLTSMEGMSKDSIMSFLRAVDHIDSIFRSSKYDDATSMSV